MTENGLIEVSESMREILAAFPDGQIFYASGKRYHPAVKDITLLLKKEYKVDPVLTEIEALDIPRKYLGEEDVVQVRGKGLETYERMAERIIRDAASAKTSDIKISRNPERTTVRFLIAGQEIDYGMNVTSSEGNELISYIFDSRDEGAGHSTKQAGQFQGFSVSSSGTTGSGIQLPPSVLKLRCEKGFHETGNDIMDHLVLRIFYRDTEEMKSIEALGFDHEVLEALQEARDRMKGAIIIGGETGDGKSTTIISAIERQYRENDGKIAIVTVEDPVEYKLNHAGIIQIPIQSSGDSAKRTQNYRSALMHFVRINPHIGMVSEVRDAEAARQVIQFIETGHQVWTTIHINNVNSIPFRLIDMGIEPTELAKPDSITLLMKQTLIPMLCRCAIKGEDGFFYRNFDGCSKCRSSVQGREAEKAWAGYQRMIAVGEVIRPNDDYLEFIRKNDAIGAKKYWMKPKSEDGLGGVSLGQKLNMLVYAGISSPKDIRKKGVAMLKEMPPMMDDFKPWLAGLRKSRK